MNAAVGGEHSMYSTLIHSPPLDLDQNIPRRLLIACLIL